MLWKVNQLFARSSMEVVSWPVVYVRLSCASVVVAHFLLLHLSWLACWVESTESQLDHTDRTENWRDHQVVLIFFPTLISHELCYLGYFTFFFILPRVARPAAEGTFFNIFFSEALMTKELADVYVETNGETPSQEQLFAASFHQSLMIFSSLEL